MPLLVGLGMPAAAAAFTETGADPAYADPAYQEAPAPGVSARNLDDGRAVVVLLLSMLAAGAVVRKRRNDRR